MKGPTEKHFDGIYANPRLMHAVGLVVGCIAQVQVKSGSVFEGVLRTVSSKADFVLEMARKVDSKKAANNPCSPPSALNLFDGESVTEKLVFRLDDVVTVSVNNVDPEYATREGFTDTAISKFNGQVHERELEPWDGGATATEGLSDLGSEGEINGWDANDMFRTNEEKYGVKSSFDSNLPGYTIPLHKQDTDAYKRQEERASKIAQEIESGFHHKTRAALENGDEEERFSAVVRPENNFRYVSRSRKPQNLRGARNSPAPSHMNRNSHQHSQVFHRVSSPGMASNHSQGSYKVVNSVPSPNCVNAVSPRPTPTSTPPTPRQPTNQMPLQQQQPMPHPPAHYQQAPPPASMPVCIAQPAVRATPPPVTPNVPQEDPHKINGEVDKTELKFAPKPPRSLNLSTSANKEMRDSITNQQMLNKNVERRKDSDKKSAVQKVRDEKTEDLKRFHEKFKLSDDPKHGHEKDSTPKPEAPMPERSNVPVAPKHHNREKPREEERKVDCPPESRLSPDHPKSSNLNPNAKEFVFNPNAKSFTPRGVPLQNVVPPPVQPPHRLHTQSPIMAMPQAHIVPGVPQVFNLAPQYVVSATPVSLPMAPPFNPAASSVTQPPRFRKGQESVTGNEFQDMLFSAMPMTLQRHDLSQPVHVQAATGQPILAQPTLSAPQFAIQYTSSPGMLHHPSGPQQQLAYAQMYQIMPRVLPPTGGVVGIAPPSGAYGESPQIPTHVYMSHPGNPGMPHSMGPSNGGQHSNPSTPQSQTPNLHPAPSPVHQPPPSGGHGQPPTPTGHPGNAPTPQPVAMYAHAHVAAQHPLHSNHTSAGQVHPFAASYGGTPQPIVLVPQQHHGPHPAAFATSLQNHLHGQAPGSHVGTPTHVMSHAPLTMIPTSAGLVSQTAISTGHYVPHSQGVKVQKNW